MDTGVKRPMRRAGSLGRAGSNVLDQRLVEEPGVLCVRTRGASHC
ncbi:MAG: hypothetical protein ACREV1_17550 [Gammaproteobacteria bacterium]